MYLLYASLGGKEKLTHPFRRTGRMSSWMQEGTGRGFDCCARVPCVRRKESEEDGATIVEYVPHHVAKLATTEILVSSSDERLHGMLPIGPRERTVPTFAIGQESGGFTALLGSPLYTNDVLRLSLGDAIHESVMALYANGFLVTQRGEGFGTPGKEPICRLWSPFSLVEKPQVQTRGGQHQWAIFKITFFRQDGQDSTYYFATAGVQAEVFRDRWVEQIVQAMSNLTLSLFPPFKLSVDPVPGRVSTCTRIMAGYLLRGGIADSATLVFCELHAFANRESRCALYKDEWCDVEIFSIPLSESSIVSTRKGEYCTVFGINDHLFCTRTEEERDIWLRAVSNIKVKLMFDAPDPTVEELKVFRSAVSERIGNLPPPLPRGGVERVSLLAAAAKGKSGTMLGMDPFEPALAQIPRRPPSCPRGDVECDPDPNGESLSSMPCRGLWHDCALGSEDMPSPLSESPRNRDNTKFVALLRNAKSKKRVPSSIGLMAAAVDTGSMTLGLDSVSATSGAAVLSLDASETEGL